MQTSGREFSLIERYFRQQASPDASVVLGIGDDCALIMPTPGMQQAISIDTSIADRHFPADAPPYLIGRRVLNVSLSDLAAMGATPRWFTLALALVEADDDWLAGFAGGLFSAAEAGDIRLIGGDTTRAGQLVISTQVQGELPPGTALTRAGAQAGEHIYVTGPLGLAAAGLALYRQQRDGPQALVNAYLDPQPQLATGHRLRGLAGSCIDISDGLLADLGHILAASAVGAELDLAAVPLDEQAIRLFGYRQALQWALTGGDDYQLCFTSRLDRAALAARGIEGVCRIGQINQADGLVFVNRPADLTITSTGFDHFA
ncbi:MAG TPA: thiamine-phosphate kinase [Pseudomonadales bacterium]